jgi:DNA-binding MarR family transcriptional regulator
MYRIEELSDKQKEKINEIIEIFKEIYATIWVNLDEEKEETKKALDKIEEAKFWAIKSIF